MRDTHSLFDRDLLDIVALVLTEWSVAQYNAPHGETRHHHVQDLRAPKTTRPGPASSLCPPTLTFRWKPGLVVPALARSKQSQSQLGRC